LNKDKQTHHWTTESSTRVGQFPQECPDIVHQNGRSKRLVSCVKRTGRRSVASISPCTLQTRLRYAETFQRKEEVSREKTDPMKVCAIAGQVEREEGMGFSRIRGGFGRCYLSQPRCVWCVVVVFRLRSTPRSPLGESHHQTWGIAIRERTLCWSRGSRLPVPLRLGGRDVLGSGNNLGVQC